jgi:hypothetical protein
MVLFKNKSPYEDTTILHMHDTFNVLAQNKDVQS